MAISEIQYASGTIDEEKLILKFDQLVDDGIIQYTSSQRAIRFQDQGFPVRTPVCPFLIFLFAADGTTSLLTFHSQIELIVSPALGAKPALGEKLDSRFRKPETKADPPSLSDIDVTGHEISPINGTHLLAFNKFSGYRPHLLLLTLDPSKRQTTDLDRADIAAAWNTLSSLSRDYIAIFNCGDKSGCSRMHKHMQLLPRPDDFVLWPELVGWERPPLSFKFCEETLSPRMSANAVARICEELVRQARAGEGLYDDDSHFPHNVIITRDWILVIPRSASGHDGVSMNAAGFLGMCWGPTQVFADRWAAVGPLIAMAGCGVPARK